MDSAKLWVRRKQKLKGALYFQRGEKNKTLKKLYNYSESRAVADARQRTTQLLEQNSILRQQVQNAQDEIKILTDIKEIPQKYQGMLIKMWREHNYKFEIKDYYVALREKQEYKAKLTKNPTMRQTSEWNHDIKDGICATLCFIQYVAGNWSWNYKHLEGVAESWCWNCGLKDWKCKGAYQATRSRIATTKRRKAFNVSVGKHGEVTCIDSDSDDHVSNDTDMD